MKHNEARCRNGEIFKYSDIRILEKLVAMRQFGLTTKDGFFELLAVNPHDHNNAPFFRYKVSPGKNESRIESDPVHGEFRDRFNKILQRSPALRVYTIDDFYKKNEAASQLGLLYIPSNTLSGYNWFNESFQKISKDCYSRWDIKGRNNAICDPTQLSPEIIFEVVHTSPPSLESFKFMCRSSVENNCIYVFFFINTQAMQRSDEKLGFIFNKIWLNEGITEIQCFLYIKDGYFYERDKQISISKLDQVDDYGVLQRPDFETKTIEIDYWKSYWICVKEKCFKPAIYKLTNTKIRV